MSKTELAGYIAAQDVREIVSETTTYYEGEKELEIVVK
jgi:hypothetical protein